MRPTRLWRTTTYAIVFLLVLTRVAFGQTDSLAPVRIAWPLLDILLVPDTSVGLRLLMSPTQGSTAGSGATALVKMDLDPVEALQWATLLARVADTAFVPGAPTLRATPVLADPHGAKHLRLVHQASAEEPTKRLYLIIADSTSQHYWRVFTTVAAIDTLREGMLQTARKSRRDSTAATVPPDDRPVQLLAVPLVKYPKQLQREGRAGRVWAEFVVNESGRAVERSIRILLTDHPLFTREIYSVLQRTRYRPALREGKPVARRVHQAFQFRMSAN